MLPSPVRSFATAGRVAFAVSIGKALVVQRVRAGAPVRFDSRFRLVLPPWLSRLTETDGSVLLAARWPEASALVVAPTSVLDPLADSICGDE